MNKPPAKKKNPPPGISHRTRTTPTTEPHRIGVAPFRRRVKLVVVRKGSVATRVRRPATCPGRRSSLYSGAVRRRRRRLVGARIEGQAVGRIDRAAGRVRPTAAFFAAACTRSEKYYLGSGLPLVGGLRTVMVLPGG